MYSNSTVEQSLYYNDYNQSHIVFNEQPDFLLQVTKSDFK